VSRRALGRGFSDVGQGVAALFPEFKATDGSVSEIALDQIRPNPYQPRQRFSDAGLASLAASLKTHGLLQPVLVRRCEDGMFELIAGERRWRAAQIAGLAKIPAIVRTAQTREMMEWAILENSQREDLNPMERAQAYARLVSEFSLTQEEIAARMEIDRSSVANFLRLIQLPKSLWNDVEEGRLSMGHAKALLSLEKESDRQAAAARIIAGEWSVRQAEAYVRKMKAAPAALPTRASDRLPEVVDMERRLRHSLGTRVRIVHRGRSGEIRITYHSLDEFDRLVERLDPPPK